MATLDWIILAIYCIGIMAMALYFRARASKGLEEFFIAGRNLPWWVIGFADVAGYTGGGQGFVMILFLSGYAGLWLMAWVSWVIWMPLVAILWATSLFSLMGGRIVQGVLALVAAVVSGAVFARTAISRLKVIGIVAP
jgi:Na+/proline symporter